MALCALNDDALGMISDGLCNPLEPNIIVAFSSANKGLRALNQVLLQQLKADREVAAALCRRMGMGSCGELREAKDVHWEGNGLCAADMATLGTLVPVLPLLVSLRLRESSDAACADGVQQLMTKVRTLPALDELALSVMPVGDAGAYALAHTLGRGALPRLRVLELFEADIGDAGFLVLAPALRELPGLEVLGLVANPFGDEGLAALVAPPPPPAGTPPLPAGGLKKLKMLQIWDTEVTDAGCATLVAALDSGTLPALDYFDVEDIPASDAAKDAVCAALARQWQGRERDELGLMRPFVIG